jgi:hypothetical protein
MSAVLLALSAANPGLLPMAVGHSGGGYRDPEFEDFTNAQVLFGFILIFGFLTIAVINLSLMEVP